MGRGGARIVSLGQTRAALSNGIVSKIVDQHGLREIIPGDFSAVQTTNNNSILAMKRDGKLLIS